MPYRPTKPMVIMSAVGTSVGIVLLFKEYAGGCRYNGLERLENKTVIVTGANKGIGKEVARDFAKRGARVIMGCRDLKKCEEARKEIALDSNNKSVCCRQLDLSSLKSIRKFASNINKDEKDLHLLINNAGVMMDASKKRLTEDGFEIQMGVNHLGHFLLTNLLLDKLKCSQPSRIINVASAAHSRVEMDFSDFNCEKKYVGRDAYGKSKLANILFTRTLSQKLKGTEVITCALHPGLVKTDIFQDMSYNKSYISYWFVSPLSWLILKTPKRGAQVVIHCALSERIENGKYYSNCQEITPSANALDESVANTLWKISEKWVRL